MRINGRHIERLLTIKPKYTGTVEPIGSITVGDSEHSEFWLEIILSKEDYLELKKYFESREND